VGLRLSDVRRDAAGRAGAHLVTALQLRVTEY
jgi:hypothetical protein